MSISRIKKLRILFLEKQSVKFEHLKSESPEGSSFNNNHLKVKIITFDVFMAIAVLSLRLIRLRGRALRLGMLGAERPG